MAKGGPKRSVGAIILSSYIQLILVTVVFFTLFFYFFTSNLLKKRAIGEFTDLSASLARNLDSEILKINIISLNVTNSRMFKELVAEHLSIAETATDEQRIRKYRNSKEITEYLGAIIGPFKPVPQINYYDFRGEMIGAGVFSRAAPRSFELVPWFEKADLSSGFKMFSLPHRDPLIEEIFPYYKDQTYVSLYRTLFNADDAPIGIIEVKQFVDMMFKNFSTVGKKIYVFNGKGEQLFPYASSPRPFSPQELSGAKEGEMVKLLNRETSNVEVVIVAGCTQADWQVVVSTEEKILLKPARYFARMVLLFSAAPLAVALLFAFRSAKRITRPLKEVHDAISELDWDTISSGDAPEVTSELNELEELKVAFRRMRQKLQESMNQALEARSREFQATLVALQSQMDPHFIYNILATVGIMAEEGMVGEISELIDHLTHLLRYISSSAASTATIGEEVEYAKRYLSCMKIRFRENLCYEIEIPESLSGVRVPKLIIQPLIENAMKYGTSGKPPWRIGLSGSLDGRLWRIAVRDSGPGFDETKLVSLKGRVAAEGGRLDTSLQIDGMGLANIFLRLRLLYGEDAIFDVENQREGGGARVTIGGRNEPG